MPCERECCIYCTQTELTRCCMCGEPNQIYINPNRMFYSTTTNPTITFSPIVDEMAPFSFDIETEPLEPLDDGSDEYQGDD